MQAIILILILLAFLAGFYIYTTQRLDVQLNIIAPSPVSSQTNIVVPTPAKPPSASPISSPAVGSPISLTPTNNLVPVANSPSVAGTPATFYTSANSVAVITGASGTFTPDPVFGSTPASTSTPASNYDSKTTSSASSTTSISSTYNINPVYSDVVITGSGKNEIGTPASSRFPSLTPSISSPTSGGSPSQTTTVTRVAGVTTRTAGSAEGLQNIDEKTARCPNILVKSGEYLLLYNTTDTHNEMPVMFNNLDEYGNYIKAQRAKGMYCPVLHLQQENNAQGQDVFRIKSTPFNDYYNEPFSDLVGQTIPFKMTDKMVFPPATVAQLSTNTSTFPFFNIEGFDGGMGSPSSVPVSTPEPAIVGAPALTPIPSLPPSNTPPQNESNSKNSLYSGFDPYGFDVGKYKKLDKVHDSTSASPMSDNPMDPNWGGTEYTKGAVDSGKYIENNVYPVTYSMPGGVQFYPGLHKTYPDPPNFVKPVGGTTPPFLPSKTGDGK